LKKGEILKYRPSGEILSYFSRKHDLHNIGGEVFCIFIKDVKNSNKLFVYCRINKNNYDYISIERERIFELSVADQKSLESMFNSVKIVDYKESAYTYGFPHKKKSCVGKIYSNFKRYEAKPSKKLGKVLDCLVVETEHGGLTFLHSECEYVKPNLNREPKKDKTFKKGTIVRYTGFNEKIDKTIPRTIVSMDRLNEKNMAVRSSVILTEDKDGNYYRDYKKFFKVL